MEYILESKNRSQQSARGAWVGILGNLVLAALKGVVGFMAGSRAMVADALHSAADLTGSLVVLVAVRVANQPADECHPYGHGKAESLATTIIGGILIFVGLRVGWDSFLSIVKGTMAVPGASALYMALFSIIVKEGMFQYKIRLGRRLQSQALTASAWEHRSDAYTSVAALIGIGGARLGLPLLDPLAGLVVALVVAKMGLDLFRDGTAPLMDRVPDGAILSELTELTAAVKGVHRVEKVLVRSMGPFFLADLTIGVPGSLSVAEGHQVAAAVKNKIQSRRSDVARVFVHVNPI